MTAHRRFTSSNLSTGRSFAFLTGCIICLVILMTTAGRSQNLVPNPSFETRDSCPSGWHIGFPFPSQGSMFASNWFSPSVGTSDYFNACAPLVPPNNGIPVSVPDHALGYQLARTGQAYGGGILDQFHCEYVESPLLTPLVSGHRYFASYWINTRNTSWGGADRFGAHFSANPVEMPNTAVLDMLTPQIESPAGVILYDTLNWMLVSGVFEAAGGERWMTIGNFNQFSTLDTILVVTPTGFGAGPFYYYYEDVCVVDMDGSPGIVTVLPLSVCNGDELDLFARPGMEHYLWNDNDTGRQKSITQPGTYWVKSVDLSTCTVMADTFIVSDAVGLLTPELGPDRIICPGDSLVLNASIPGVTQYLWNNGSTASTLTVRGPGEYIVSVSSVCSKGVDTIRVTSGTDCNSSSGSDNPGGDSSVVVRSCLYIPNAFTPNGDGLNDRLKVGTVCESNSFMLTVYNRFGEAVFASNHRESGWDGTYRGKPCDAGTYFYLLYYSGDRGQQLQKGDITLIR
ncbi:MAG: gliding motility-associated C-terminal domain-containing protein [Sphingobacteriales bacterium]|nr:MAG: gliding motility-associated C-terminal domain-containing protein [Sphingobacteriales bacterium]